MADNRPCTQKDCPRTATTRVLWPGQPPRDTCDRHAAQAKGVAEAMGFFLWTEPLAAEQQGSDDAGTGAHEEAERATGTLRQEAHTEPVAVDTRDSLREAPRQRIGTLTLEGRASLTEVERKTLLLDCQAALVLRLHENGYGSCRVMLHYEDGLGSAPQGVDTPASSRRADP